MAGDLKHDGQIQRRSNEKKIVGTNPFPLRTSVKLNFTQLLPSTPSTLARCLCLYSFTSLQQGLVRKIGHTRRDATRTFYDKKLTHPFPPFPSRLKFSQTPTSSPLLTVTLFMEEASSEMATAGSTFCVRRTDWHPETDEDREKPGNLTRRR